MYVGMYDHTLALAVNFSLSLLCSVTSSYNTGRSIAPLSHPYCSPKSPCVWSPCFWICRFGVSPWVFCRLYVLWKICGHLLLPAMSVMMIHGSFKCQHSFYIICRQESISFWPCWACNHMLLHALGKAKISSSMNRHWLSSLEGFLPMRAF